MEKTWQLRYDAYGSVAELNDEDRQLVLKARGATDLAYAPYSRFKVGAAALLADGRIFTGANQENASYPVAICAERTLLGTLSSVAPGAVITSFAISYHNLKGKSHDPISPCGVCRQSLTEYKMRQHSPIRLLLSGYDKDSNVLILPDVDLLLPFLFSAGNMQ